MKIRLRAKLNARGISYADRPTALFSLTSPLLGHVHWGIIFRAFLTHVKTWQDYVHVLITISPEV